MKNKLYIIGIFVIIVILIIGGYVLLNHNNTTVKVDGKIKVIATLFPQYDFVKQIGKDKVSASILLPPGVESHIFEPKPSDIVKIQNSDLFIYTGSQMEPWANTIIQSMNGLTVVDASKNIQLIKEKQNEEHGEYDPHIWLDIDNAKIMIDNIVDGLSKIDPSNKDFYKQNAEDYKKELNKLNQDITDVVSNAKRNELVFGGKFALQYFMNKYNLNYVSAYDSDSTEDEPSVAKISQIISEVKKNNIPVVFYEEFSSHIVADSIANQSGAKTLLFHSAHNVSKDELANGITFIDIMRQNLNNLKIALN